MAKSTTRRTPLRRKHKKPPSANLLMVQKWLDGSERVGYTFDMGIYEFAAIGEMTVHWAFLEEAMYKRTVLFAKRAKVKVPQDARDLSFSKRLRALRLLMQAVITHSEIRKRWNWLISAIGNANGTRQKITHGLWSYDARNPARLFSSPRPSVGKWLTPFNVEKIDEFAGQLGAYSYALLHPGPGGRPSKKEPSVAYASRLFRLRMSGKAEALGYPPPTRVTSMPPLTPSQESLLRKIATKDH
jgi:hypothetical protein